MKGTIPGAPAKPPSSGVVHHRAGDTARSWLVSAVATRGRCADILQATLAKQELVLGGAVRTELRREAILAAEAPALQLKIRDAADRVVLAEGIAGRADVLVTGDRDLPDIAARASIPIPSPRGFRELLRTPTGETK